MALKRREEHHESNDRWLVSYADFITLMFAFFTVLYATSEQNVDKTKKFEQSIREHLMKFGAMGESGQKINQGAEYNSPIESPLKPFPQGSADTQKAQRKVETYLQKNLKGNDIEKLITDISPDAVGVRISLSGDFLFDRGSVQMRRDALPILDKIAKAVKESNRRLIIEGNTDVVAIAKEMYPTAWELASMQATKVLRYFAKVHKIEPSRLAAISFGDQRPLPPNNNRIDILIVTEDLPY